MELGHGGMGLIDLALNTGPQGFIKLVVLKRLRPELLGNDDARQMFLEEARISARLAHANVVQVFEIIELHGAPTMVMEYLDGQSLWQLLHEAREQLPRDLHFCILTKVLAGLHAAHELRDYDGTPLGIVHRDVSPHNVFVQYDGQVKVLDFGIAKAEGSDIETKTGVLKGKLHYMAPEQMARSATDRRADVYAVGLMLREAITGTRAWGELPESEIMLRHLTAKPPLLDPDEAPEALRNICNRAMAALPEDRYATALEFQAALEAFLQTQRSDSSADRLARFVAEQFAEARALRSNLVSTHVRRVSEPPERDEFERTIRESLATRPAPKETVPAGPHALKSNAKRMPRWLLPVTGLALGLSAAAVLAYALAQKNATADAVQAASAALDERCPSGQKRCGSQCVATALSEFGCAELACQPCQVPNATPRCNAKQECDIAVCYQDYDDCDGNRSNGCEVEVRLDPDNCGACSKRCPDLPHAARGCGDACTIWRCEPGYRDCNGVATDGCEVDVGTDIDHCGHCDSPCPRGHRCKGALCAR